MKKLLIKYFSLLLFLGIVGCESREINPESLDGKEYFPLEKGLFTIYKIEKTNYNVVSGNTKEEYFIKEVIADTTVDSYNNVNYIINRSKRSDLNAGEWVLDSVFKASRVNNNFIRSEQNISFVKLVTPIKEGKEWNGNAYNILEPESYKMKKVNFADSVNGMSFANTLTVVQRNDSSTISQDYRIEKYAKGVGMVYKKSIVTTNYQKNGELVIPIQIDQGIDLTQTIIEYGKE